MRPIGAKETEVTHVAVRYANASAAELLAALKTAKANDDDDVMRQGVRRVLRMRGWPLNARDLEGFIRLAGAIDAVVKANGDGAISGWR